MRKVESFINGESFKTKKTYIRENPATLSPLLEVSLCSKKEIDYACDTAFLAFGSWSKTPPVVRGQILFNIASEVKAKIDLLALINTQETGKPIKESTLVELGGVVRTFEYYAGLATKIKGDSQIINEDLVSFTFKEPVGVVAQILPWNFPLLLAAWKIAPALAAGCSVVIKPSELTPSGTVELAKIITDSGVPKGVVNVCPGMGEVAGDALVKNNKISKISFTGSSEIGKTIVKNSADKLAKVSLELGGKAPNIIFEDANLNSCIEANLRGGFFNQGENCTAVTRLFVHKKIFKKFVNSYIKNISKINQDNPENQNSQMGALISDQHFKKVKNCVAKSIKEGGKILYQGKISKSLKGYFYPPTLVELTDKQNILFKEEVFGPVVAIMQFEDEREVVSMANDTIYGLAGGIWTQDISRAFRVARSIEAGYLWVNTYGGIIPETPYGGFKQSGVGKELGSDGLEEYLRVKNVSVFTGASLPSWYGKK
tara:strand:- start:9809 stop:11266 length:1458 start_codon:yes stop_codon:yes gene_type:complete